MKTIYFITGMTKEMLQLLDKSPVRWVSGEKPSKFTPKAHPQQCVCIIEENEMTFSYDADRARRRRDYELRVGLAYIISYNLSVDYEKQLFMNAFDLNEPENVFASVTLEEGSTVAVEVRENDVKLTIDNVRDVDTDELEEHSFYFSHNEFKRLASIVNLTKGELE